MLWAISPPPPIWQWFGVIIGSLAFVGAMLIIPQMIWGNPKAIVSWAIDDTVDGKVLECRIWNEPLTGKRSILAWRRPIEDLTAMIDIVEDGSNTVIVSRQTPKIRNFAGDYAYRVKLPASWVNASFGVVFVKDGDDIVKYFREGSKTTFGIGRYKVLANIIADNKPIKSEVVFEVNERQPYLRIY